jgi:hypothetical protein
LEPPVVVVVGEIIGIILRPPSVKVRVVNGEIVKNTTGHDTVACPFVIMPSVVEDMPLALQLAEGALDNHSRARVCFVK